MFVCLFSKQVKLRHNLDSTIKQAKLIQNTNTFVSKQAYEHAGWI